MKFVRRLDCHIRLSAFLFILIALLGAARAKAADNVFVSRVADVNGVKLHYTIGGHGPALILLHGYAKTSRMWNPILPVLGKRFTIIAPDLPGIGEIDGRLRLRRAISNRG
jgi:hypothetical protein